MVLCIWKMTKGYKNAVVKCRKHALKITSKIFHSLFPTKFFFCYFWHVLVVFCKLALSTYFPSPFIFPYFPYCPYFHHNPLQYQYNVSFQIGRETGRAMGRLVKGGLNLPGIHLVGHSLGAHIVSATARFMADNNMRLSRWVAFLLLPSTTEYQDV